MWRMLELRAAFRLGRNGTSKVTAQVASELSSWQGGTALAPNRHEMGALHQRVRIHGGYGEFEPRIDLSSYHRKSSGNRDSAFPPHSAGIPRNFETGSAAGFEHAPNAISTRHFLRTRHFIDNLGPVGKLESASQSRERIRNFKKVSVVYHLNLDAFEILSTCLIRQCRIFRHTHLTCSRATRHGRRHRRHEPRRGGEDGSRAPERSSATVDRKNGSLRIH